MSQPASVTKSPGEDDTAPPLILHVGLRLVSCLLDAMTCCHGSCIAGGGSPTSVDDIIHLYCQSRIHCLSQSFSLTIKLYEPVFQPLKMWQDWKRESFARASSGSSSKTSPKPSPPPGLRKLRSPKTSPLQVPMQVLDEFTESSKLSIPTPLDLGASALESGLHVPTGAAGNENTLQNLIERKRLQNVMERDVLWPTPHPLDNPIPHLSANSSGTLWTGSRDFTTEGGTTHNTVPSHLWTCPWMMHRLPVHAKFFKHSHFAKRARCSFFAPRLSLCSPL